MCCASEPSLISRDAIRPADLRGFELISFASSTPMRLVVDRIVRQAGELYQRTLELTRGIPFDAVL